MTSPCHRLVGGSWGDRRGLCTLQPHPEARVVFGPNSLLAFTLGKAQSDSRQGCSEGVGAAATAARESVAVVREGESK